jgi:hypothetical protein
MMKRLFAMLSAVGFLMGAAGCHEHYAHEPGVAHYSMGEFYSTEKIPFERAWSGALKAMEELEFVVTKQEKDALTAYLIARGAGDKKIEVNLEKQSDELTEIRIWVDTLGDESISKLILDKIKERSKLV